MDGLKFLCKLSLKKKDQSYQIASFTSTPPYHLELGRKRSGIIISRTIRFPVLTTRREFKTKKTKKFFATSDKQQTTKFGDKFGEI